MRRYIHGRELDEIVRADLGGTTIYPLQDELGNVERIIDVSGTTLERYEYEGYGHFTVFNPASAPLTTSALGWKWLFQGREYQPALAAYDFRARTLWPDLGRFGQEDPARGREERSAYEAFLGSPVNLSDPKGLYEEDVHHYLTDFLSCAAGFDVSLANRIGYETGLLDFDERDAMYKVRDLSNMEEYHFVSATRLNMMEQAAHVYVNEHNWRRLGEYLHALEDSYSHQDDLYKRDFAKQYHDTVAGFEAGHAQHKRDPDLTAKRPELAFVMAQDVHEQLHRFCKDYAGRSETRCLAVPWPTVNTYIAAFITEPTEMFIDEIMGRQVPTVLDYSKKVKKLAGHLIPDVDTDLKEYETKPRRAAYLKSIELRKRREAERRRAMDRAMSTP